MSSLADFPDEVWQGIMPRIRNRHFVRLICAGDTRLTSRLRSIRGRHFKVPQEIDRCTSAMRFAVTTAQSLRMRAYQREWFLSDPTPLTGLTKLALHGVQVDQYPPTLQCYDFAALASLQTLTIGGYSLSRPLLLPMSITAVKASEFRALSSPSGDPIEGMSKLTSLTKLHLAAEFSWAFKFKKGTAWPPSLESLHMHADGESVCPPPTLKRLKQTLINSEVDVAQLVADQCPHLTSLTVEGSVTVTSRLPEGLETLIVDGSLEGTSTTSLDETIRNLPQSLRRLHFQDLLGENKTRALSHVLPRLDFADFDNACRVLFFRCHCDAEDEEWLINHASRYYLGDRSTARSYIVGMRKRHSPYWTPWRDTMNMENLFVTTNCIGEYLATQLLPQLTRKRFTRTAIVASAAAAAEISLKMLELGVLDHIGPLGSMTPAVLTLRIESLQNLVELRVGSRDDELDKMGVLFRRNGTFASLRRIEINMSPWPLDRFLALIYAHRLRLPRLESISYIYDSLSRDLSMRAVSADSAAKMAEMRMYLGKTAHAYAVAFVYRTEPPRAETIS